jgi:Fuc2NAc and GlcNAc transferase
VTFDVLTWAVVIAAGVSSWALTGWFREYAIKRQMVDVPNARSSHRVTTPRGGGGAIVVATTAALAWCAWASGSVALAATLVGGLVVAGIGFVDDHRAVPPVMRLVGHTLAAAFVVRVLDVQSLGIPGGPILGIAGAALAVVFVTWFINLTNFMDGIDGIAGVETLTVCAAAAVLARVITPDSALWIEPAVLAAASIGFLIWNWPPARVFMGDVGSGYVGYMLAVLLLRAATASPVLGWCWLILCGVFIVDATFTLGRRTVRGDRLFEAHSSHAYQHLARAWGHRPVTVLVALINVCWLMPVAVLVALGHVSGPTGLLIAYVPLIVGAARFKAGSVSRP